MQAWDSYDAYLFDIDGTLLQCTDAVHYFGFCEVLSGVAGRPLNLDGVVAQGNVDPGILRDALMRAEVPEAVWRPQLSRMEDELSQFVENHQSELCIETLPGVVPVLQHLRARGAKVGVGTGNLERIGWAKLAHCGLRPYFDFGGFSDGVEWRRDMIARGIRTARAMAGAAATICVIGDTPSDVRAARDNGLDVIAVATGVFSMEELQAASPDVLVRSLQELLPRTEEV